MADSPDLPDEAYAAKRAQIDEDLGDYRRIERESRESDERRILDLYRFVGGLNAVVRMGLGTSRYGGTLTPKQALSRIADDLTLLYPKLGLDLGDPREPEQPRPQPTEERPAP
jgi:hypothetical protein